MRGAERDQATGGGEAAASDPLRKAPQEATAAPDTLQPPFPATRLAFAAQIDGQWHAGICLSPDIAIVEGPIDADTFGEMRECRLRFPFGQLEIALVRRAEVLPEPAYLGAARLVFPAATSPARAELDALIQLLTVRQRRFDARKARRFPDAALLAYVPAPAGAARAGLRARLARWLGRAPSPRHGKSGADPP